MVEHIEGDWKNFQFKMAEPKDYQDILIHMRKNFYKDEPLLMYMGIDEGLFAGVDKAILEVLNMNISFIAVDKQSGEIAGVRLTLIEERGIMPNLSCPTNPKHQIIIAYLDSNCTDEGDVFKRCPDINKYANFFMASVDSKYRGQGLATEMYKRSIAYLKSKGIPVAKSIFTSPFTRKAAVNLGFEELKRSRLIDYEYTPGVFAFPNASPEDVASTMILRLS